MATLSLDIGAYHVEVSGNDQKATSIVTEFSEAMGFEGTAQARGVMVLRALIQHMTEVSETRKRADAARAALHDPANASTKWQDA